MDERVTKKVGLAAEAAEARPTRWGKLFALLRQKVTPRLGLALVAWRVEAWLATPLALALVVTLGRWPAALAMGGIMAVYSALFLFLLDGERAVEEMRGWVRQRRYVRRHILPVAERRGRVGAVQRALAIPAVVMIMGPFWRAVTFHLFRVPRLAAYALSVGGSIPHSLLWTGVVLGGVWEGLVWPFLDSRWL